MQQTLLEQLQPRLNALLATGSRKILGLTGAPGSGKSTLAQQLLEWMPERAVIVPMDGFHLANSELRRLDRSARKGAEDTFDSAGYVALLERLRVQRLDEVVYAPEFQREIEESIAGAIPVLGQQLVITEGNYLLLNSGHWSRVRSLLDEVWYVSVDDAVRTQRLIARHMLFGRSESAARLWVERTDEPNAARIAATASRADYVVHLASDNAAPGNVS